MLQHFTEIITMAFNRSILLLFLAIALVQAASAEVTLSAELKPLTPIKETNLLLNTAYKWHDVTKPGCYATWFWEKYQAWIQKYKGIRIICNADDQKRYDTADADWVFQRTQGEESTSEYDGTVKITNVGTGETLNTWKSGGVWWLGITASEGTTPARDMWNVRSDSNDENRLQLEIQDWYLAQDPSAANQQAFSFLQYNKSEGFPYSFVSAIRLEAEVYDFKFVKPNLADEFEKLTSQKELAESFYIENNSSGVVSRSIKVSKNVTNEFSWGMSQSLKTFTKVIFDSYDGKVETSFDANIEARQNWKNSVEKVFELRHVAQIPAHSRVNVSAYLSKF